MDLDGYKKMFVRGKEPMTLKEAAADVRHILNNECPMLPKRGHLNKREYDRRLALRAVCEELEKAFRTAPPWKDYREIIAELEWPYMRRVAGHVYKDIYSGPDGKKLGEADVWFLDMWIAYHNVLLRMPGDIPENPQWIIYRCMMANALKKLEKYRRK